VRPSRAAESKGGGKLNILNENVYFVCTEIFKLLNKIKNLIEMMASSVQWTHIYIYIYVCVYIYKAKVIRITGPVWPRGWVEV
jgi:hypothetical protein